METKVCRICLKELSLDMFYSRKGSPDGKRNECKSCHLKQIGRYSSEHAENIAEYQKRYRQTHKAIYSPEKSKKYREKNRDKRAAWIKAWKIANRERVRQYHSSYISARRRTDIEFRLACSLRSRLVRAINRNQKAGSAVLDLGCSIEYLKMYLEGKFQPGMSWDNWSQTGWHIDHVRPLASFDLTDREQFLQACHYTNLQPLWAIDNLVKNDTYVPLDPTKEV